MPAPAILPQTLTLAMKDDLQLRVLRQQAVQDRNQVSIERGYTKSFKPSSGTIFQGRMDPTLAFLPTEKKFGHTHLHEVIEIEIFHLPQTIHIGKLRQLHLGQGHQFRQVM